MADYYLLIKALHIIAFISWMAGMLYLPRLYVYHAGVEVGSDTSEMLKTMEHRLLRYIINPAMIATFLLGGMLLVIIWESSSKEGWLHGKLFLVFLLAAVHGILARRRKDFFYDRNTRSATYYRILNEIPTVIMVIIVLLVVLKP